MQFHVVDTFAGGAHVGYQDLWPEFSANFEHAGLMEAIRVHRATSEQAAAAFEPETVDFAFIAEIKPAFDGE